MVKIILAVMLMPLIFCFACGNSSKDSEIQPSASDPRDSITQFGISWYFDAAYETGQFVNGDYWVVGPVSIVRINPPSVEIDGRTKNGSMINPDPNIGNKGYDKEAQGYDSHMWLEDHHYYPELNVALGVNAESPLILPPGSSLVSCISVENPMNRPQLQTAAVLTVVDKIPDEGSFRPPYSGTDKTIKHNISDANANLSNLLSLDRSMLANVPSVEIVQDWFKRPWLEHIPGYLGAYIHPFDNMPEYGGNVATRISEGSIWLHLDFTSEEKMPLLIGFLQCGIDFYGIIQNGYEENDKIMQWWASGGQCAGRKWPILFAGEMLNDQDMIDIVSNSDIVYQEDGQTFYVTQEAIDYTEYNQTMCGHNESNYPCGGYTESLLGMPDWGIAHAVLISRDTPRWETMYRQCCTAKNWGGFILSAIMMGLIDEWGHNAIFDYMDRYFHYEDTYNDGIHRQDSPFVGSMWNEYRENFISSWPLADWSAINELIYDMYPEDH